MSGGALGGEAEAGDPAGPSAGPAPVPLPPSWRALLRAHLVALAALTALTVGHQFLAAHWTGVLDSTGFRLSSGALIRELVYVAVLVVESLALLAVLRASWSHLAEPGRALRALDPGLGRGALLAAVAIAARDLAAVSVHGAIAGPGLVFDLPRWTDLDDTAVVGILGLAAWLAWPANEGPSGRGGRGDGALLPPPPALPAAAARGLAWLAPLACAGGWWAIRAHVRTHGAIGLKLDLHGDTAEVPLIALGATALALWLGSWWTRAEGVGADAADRPRGGGDGSIATGLRLLLALEVLRLATRGLPYPGLWDRVEVPVPAAEAVLFPGGRWRNGWVVLAEATALVGLLELFARRARLLATARAPAAAERAGRGALDLLGWAIVAPFTLFLVAAGPARGLAAPPAAPGALHRLLSLAELGVAAVGLASLALVLRSVLAVARSPAPGAGPPGAPAPPRALAVATRSMQGLAALALVRVAAVGLARLSGG